MATSEFQDLFIRHLESKNLSVRKLAQLLEGTVHENTLYSWISSTRPNQPRYWQPLLEIARVFELNRAQADAFLSAAGHPGIDELWTSTGDLGELGLLKTWRMSNLLPPLKPFRELVGREEPARRLKDTLLASRDFGAFTIWGPPGVGKTSLSIHLANDPDVNLKYGDGVLWLPVGREPDLSGLLAEIWTGLGGSRTDLNQGRSLNERLRMVRWTVQHRRLLLVLDDVWSVDHAQFFLLGGAGNYVVLTTRLDEIGLSISPDSMEELEELDEPQRLALLLEIVPELGRWPVPELERLARRIGGAPLMLELAGGYIRKESHRRGEAGIRDALEHLGDPSFRLQLSQPPRQPPVSGRAGKETVLNLVAASEDLLSPAARRILQALTVFPEEPNTFSEAAVLSISEADSAAFSELVGLAMVKRKGGGRYTMHALIRDYVDVLYGPGERDAQRFEQYYLQLLRNARTDPVLLDGETRNVHRALELAIAHRRVGVFGESASLYQYILLVTGAYEEAIRLFDENEDFLREEEAWAYWIELLIGKVSTLRKQHQIARMKKNLDRALSVLPDVRETRLRSELAMKLHHQRGLYHYFEGDLEARDRAYAEALHYSETAGDPIYRSRIIKDLGVFATDRSDYELGQAYLEEALAIAREAGEIELVAANLLNLGHLEGQRGDRAAAVDYYLESYRYAEMVSQRDLMAHSWINIGQNLIQMGKYDEAAVYMLESEALARNPTPIPERVFDAVLGRCEIALMQNQLDEAAELLGEARILAADSAQSMAKVEEFTALLEKKKIT